MMNNRFRVGEVARLFKLPASTLRYYDEIGLFRPKYTDPETSYRYYGVEQFQILDTIIFKEKWIFVKRYSASVRSKDSGNNDGNFEEKA